MTPRSAKRLEQAHPELKRLFLRAAINSPVHFEVGEVLRTRALQEKYVRKGASQTMNSRHLAHPQDGLSRAVDIYCLIDGKVSWAWPLYTKAAEHIKQVALELGIPLNWGGDWKKFKDGPHFELSRQSYP